MPPLTKEFLLSRGRCCGNGCVNCPYEETSTRKDSSECQPKQNAPATKPAKPSPFTGQS
ncbi:DUF5522 domain-containing protein [Kordiimonas sp.]|uniref:DUF5522 domain-containing protein n=1 Tax=Kordiimonas sp. TaxID=1970157 RepID=UPI003A92F9EF